MGGLSTFEVAKFAKWFFSFFMIDQPELTQPEGYAYASSIVG